MHRRTRFICLTALVAVLAATGCYPVVSNQRAAQQDLVGDVTVSGDVCTSPLVLPFLLMSGIGGFDPGDLRAAASETSVRKLQRAAESNGFPRLGPPPEEMFGCPSDEDLEEILSGDDLPTELSIIAGLPHQVLVAYRIPKGFAAPETFQAKGRSRVSVFFAPDAPLADRGAASTLKDVDVTFKRAPAIDAQVGEFLRGFTGPDAQAALRDGDQLVGYISSVLPGPLSGDLKVQTGFGLPGATSADPYAGSFNSLTMLGSRIAVDESMIPEVTRAAQQTRALRGGPEEIVAALSDERPVECLQTADSVPLPRSARGGVPTGLLELFSLAFCPMPDIVAGEFGSAEEWAAYLQGVNATVRDLRVAGGEGFAEQGSAAAVPFTLRTTGPESDQQLAFTATTALGGAAATPAQATSGFPAAGDHGRSVTVQIPADAVPGTYDVTLTAKAGGQTRTGTGRVVVLPKAPAGQQQSSQQGRDNVYMDRDGNIAFGWVCPPVCGNAQADVTGPKAGIAPRANTAQVSKPRLLRIARGTFKADAGKRVRVKVRLFPKARRAIRRGRNVKAIIVVRRNGTGVPSVRRVTIKMRKAKR
jgi:hypothetical protein